ncbi:MAG TPA: homocysteine S-methyltransferase family protein [Gaiellaceae bacterium]
MTDGGMETTLIFHHGFELPCFASFTLLRDEAGRAALRSYFEPYLELAREHGVGIVLDTPTWRASSDWGAQLGYSDEELALANRDGVALIAELRDDWAGEVSVVVSGCVGPRGDAYSPSEVMTDAEARQYHETQIRTLTEAGADVITGLTLAYAAEAVGIVRAAQATGMPVVVSFTVETDGRLPDGQPLRAAIEHVDAATDAAPAYFMVNCAHPAHFADVLGEDGPWLRRIRGLRANASKKSHAELDESDELDAGDPAELGGDYRALRDRLPELLVVGGCCGTDERHIGAICEALT